ncbi:MAG: hypothetical protein LUE93_10560 [Bacteroides sp.]|nr:hypothetical protein [Bacteroides sp.]
MDYNTLSNSVKKHAATLGATYSPEQKLNQNYWQQRGSNKEDINTTFGIPHQLGIGVAYEYDKRVTVLADYTLQKWSDVEYRGITDYYCDRSVYAAGVEFLPDPFKRKYFSRVKYRLGGYYSDPYYKIKGERATKEYGISAGIGLPMLQSKSVVNVSAQYVNVSAQLPGQVDEKYLKFTVGLTFNETWFVKRKVR